MAAICARCVFFRKARLPDQLLARVVSANDSAVSNALLKIQEEQQKQRENEAQYKARQSNAGREEWMARPVTMDHCGLREREAIYLIPEIKNLGGNCADFREGRPEKRSCADCAHRVPATGVETDQKMERMYSEMINADIHLNSESKVSEEMLKSYRQNIGTRQARDINGAYFSSGVMGVKPTYLDICGKFSTEDEFVVAILENPHHICASWEPAASAGAERQASAADPASSASTPGSPAPDAAAAGPPAAHAAALPSSRPAAAGLGAPAAGSAAPAGPPPGFVTPTLPVSPDTVLAPGSPPLKQKIVEDICQFFAWILDIPIPDAVREMLKSDMISAWTQSRQAHIRSYLSMIPIIEAVMKARPAEQDAFREAIQQEFVQQLRADSGAVSQTLYRLYLEANAPIAPGEPPLTREISDCLAQFIAFLAELETHNWIDYKMERLLPGPVLDAFADRLASQYASLPRALRYVVAEMPKVWTNLNATWNQLGPVKRVMLKQELVEKFQLQELQSILWAAKSAVPPQRYEPASGGAAGGAQEWRGPGQPAAQSSGRVGNILDNYSEVSEKRKQEMLAQAGDNPQLKAQIELHHAQQTTQFLSNVVNIMHQTSMAIVNNIK